MATLYEGSLLIPFDLALPLEVTLNLPSFGLMSRKQGREQDVGSGYHLVDIVPKKGGAIGALGAMVGHQGQHKMRHCKGKH